MAWGSAAVPRNWKRRGGRDTQGCAAVVRIYLDACCPNRPFDEQMQARQARIQEEAPIVPTTLSRVETGQWQWLGSDILCVEVDHITDVT